MKKNYIIIGSGIVLAGIGIYIAINNAKKSKELDELYSILQQNTGITGTSYDNAVNPQFWVKSNTTKPLIDAQKASEVAKQINDNLGLLKLNFNSILSIIRLQTSKSNISRISGAYNILYKKDLYSELKFWLWASQLKQIEEAVNALPK